VQTIGEEGNEDVGFDACLELMEDGAVNRRTARRNTSAAERLRFTARIGPPPEHLNQHLRHDAFRAQRRGIS
jgi:hypothetical protein